LLDKLDAMSREGKNKIPEFAELKRRFGWEFNGMRLHEYYFGNMVKGGVAADAGVALSRKVAEAFGGLKAWEDDFKATGTMRGIGWVILYYDSLAGRLFNSWIDEHALGHPSGASPILIMDVFEHAFISDYGLKRVDYIEAFFKAIDWSAAARRFDTAAKAPAVL